MPNNQGIGSIARAMALKQKEISVSEFFQKNRHLLGYDNPTRALLTAVKEAVDNSLDACEEAGILPEITVKILQKAENRFRIIVEDNGPGIVKSQIPKIFGKLLYGSKFHRLKMSRGQQGIGISGAVLYGQLTTGNPSIIISRIDPNRSAYRYEIFIDTKANEPIIQREQIVKWDKPHGTQVEIEIEGRYLRGDRSIDEYVQLCALSNPYATIEYFPPNGTQSLKMKRIIKQLPTPPKTIKPHPYGVELGNLIELLSYTKTKRVVDFLRREFSRVSEQKAIEICQKAGFEPKTSPRKLTREDAEKLYNAINQTKIMAPPLNCLSPIGEEEIISSLKQNFEAQFYSARSRKPEVYRGNPFQIEVGIAYGIRDYPQGESAKLIRFANKVPLLYQQGACALTKAVTGVDWKNYLVNQPKNALPEAPLVIIVHIASVWVPFTSEAKEAIAHYPEIIKETKLALQEVGRELAIFLRKKQIAEYERKRRSIFELYSEEVAKSLQKLSHKDEKEIKRMLHDLIKKFTKKGEI
jgi:DNA topoisomerase-6 subunit B